MLERIKRLTSHAGYGRYFAECDDTDYVIDRQRDIPSPAAFAATHYVFAHEGNHIIIVETAHKRYDVFSVPSELLRVRTDND